MGYRLGLGYSLGLGYRLGYSLGLGYRLGYRLGMGYRLGYRLGYSLRMGYRLGYRWLWCESLERRLREGLLTRRDLSPVSLCHLIHIVIHTVIHIVIQIVRHIIILIPLIILIHLQSPHFLPYSRQRPSRLLAVLPLRGNLRNRPRNTSHHPSATIPLFSSSDAPPSPRRTNSRCSEDSST